MLRKTIVTDEIHFAKEKGEQHYKCHQDQVGVPTTMDTWWSYSIISPRQPWVHRYKAVAVPGRRQPHHRDVE